MRKTLICAAVVGALALTGGIDSSYAQPNSGGGGHGASGGNAGAGQGGSHTGGSNAWRGGSSGDWRGGGWRGDGWRGGGWRGGGWHRGGGYGRSSFGIAIGAPFGYWGAGYYPYYDPYYYPLYAGPVYADPVYSPPVAYSEPSQPVYTQQDPGYRYYCPDPAGYYPSIQNCSRGWLKVVPDSATQSAPPAYQPRQ